MEMIISHIEVLNVSDKAKKKILNWLNKSVNQQMEYFTNSLKSEDAFKERYETQKTIYVNSILALQEKVKDATNDFHKTKEVLKDAIYKDNLLTRIFVDEYLFKAGLSSVVVSNKVYVKLAEEYLIGVFGENINQQAKEKEKQEYQERIKKEREEARICELNHYLSVAKGYIDFVKDKTGYKIQVKQSGKFTKYIYHNPETHQYIIAKRNDGYKCFHEIMKYAFQEHEGDILKAVEYITQQYRNIMDAVYGKK